MVASMPAFPAAPSESEPDAVPGLSARDPRTNTMLAAVIHFAGQRADVFLRDVSATGALMDGPVLPKVGESVLLERGTIRVTATVIWRHDRRCGVHYDHVVPVAEMMRRVGAGSSAQQARIDQVQRQLRSGYVAPMPAAPAPAPRALRSDFGYACRLVETVGDELARDAYVLSRYGPTLQKLDELMQLLRRLEAGALPGPDGR